MISVNNKNNKFKIPKDIKGLRPKMLVVDEFYNASSLYPYIMEDIKTEVIEENQRIFEESMVNRNVVSCMSRKSSSI